MGRLEHRETIQKKLIELVDNYPPLPAFLNRLLSLNADPESTLEEICRVVEAEVSLVASIIKLVNSPLYGFSNPVRSIPRAITVLGRNELMNLVLGTAMFTSFKGFKQKKKYMSVFGYHSFKCAIIARYLGKQMNQDSGDLFLAGLLHDIGKNVIFRTLPEDILETVYPQLPTLGNDIEKETEHFGIDHTTLGERLLKAWHFPEALSTTVRHHHAPLGTALYFPLPLLVSTANNLLHLLDCEEEKSMNPMTLYQELFTDPVSNTLQKLGFTLRPERVPEILNDLHNELERNNDIAEMFT